jgi:hypothetical protein
MTESGYKMLPPDKVRAEIEATLDPSEVNQLNINAEYNYRNFTPDNLKSEVNTVYGEREEIYNNYIKKLELDKLDNANNPQILKEIDSAIATQNDKLNSLKRNKQDTLSAIDNNPTAVKSYLYRNKWLDGMTGMIGYTEESQKIVDNPVRKQAWDEYMDWNKFKLDQDKYALDQKKYELDVLNSQKKKPGEDGDNLGPSGLNAPLSNPTALTFDQFNQKAVDMYEEAEDKKKEALVTLYPQLFKEPQYLSNPDGTLRVKYIPKDKNTAIQIEAVTKNLEKKYAEGSEDLHPIMKSYFDTYYPQIQLANKMKDVSKKLETDADRYMRTQSEHSADFQKLESQKKFLKNIPSQQIATRNGAITVSGTEVNKVVSVLENEIPQPARSVSSPNFIGSPTLGGSFSTSNKNSYYTDEQLQKYGLTREMFDNILNNSTGQLKTALNDITKTIGNTKSAINSKNKYLNAQLRPYQFLQSTTEIQIPTNEPKLARNWASVINGIMNQRTQNGSTLGGNTDWDAVNKMFTDTNVSGLSLYFSQSPTGGNPKLLVSNSNVDDGKRQEIIVDIPTAKNLGLYKQDDVASMRANLALNQGRTTGKTKYGQIGKYQVQYEVNPYLNSYIPTLYVTLPGQFTSQPIPVSEGGFNSLESVNNFLRNPQLESYLDQKLGVKAQSQSTQTNPLIQSNPFSQQAQQAGIGPNQ